MLLPKLSLHGFAWIIVNNSSPENYRLIKTMPIALAPPAIAIYPGTLKIQGVFQDLLG